MTKQADAIGMHLVADSALEYRVNYRSDDPRPRTFVGVAWALLIEGSLVLGVLAWRLL